jgi:hypothetical protein
MPLSWRALVYTPILARAPLTLQQLKMLFCWCVLLAWCAGPLRAKFSLLNQGKQWESRLAVISAWLLFISLRAQAVRASKFFGLLFDLVRAPPRASS